MYQLLKTKKNNRNVVKLAGRISLILATCFIVAACNNVTTREQAKPVPQASVKPPTSRPEPKKENPAPKPPPKPKVTNAPTALSKSEVNSLFANNSVHFGSSDSQFAALHNADGSLSGKTWGSGSESKGKGQWKVDEKGNYCRKWDNAWAGGKWGCFKVYKSGNKVQLERVSGAGANGSMKVVPGNAYEL